MSLLSMLAQLWTVQRSIRDFPKYERAIRNPQAAQHQFLFDQLRREADTAYGRDHGFSDIRTLADFRRQIPIQDYSALEPYIERVKLGETEALFHRQRVRMFALTSGTTSARKFIPVTDRVLENYRRIWTAWGLMAYASRRSLFRHARLTFVSDWDEFRTPAGIPCGSISGFTSQLQSWVVRRGYILPTESAKLYDTQAKYYLAWRLGALRTIGTWISPNPSTLIQLGRYGTEAADTLLRDLHDGTLTDRYAWTPDLKAAIAPRLTPQPARARELAAILERTGQLRPRDVWPELKLIGCWTGGSVQAYLRSFPELFGDVALRDLGLIASEGRMTFPVADNTPAGVLEVVSGFYEFVPVDEIDSPQPTVLEAHELQEGRDYFILLTNASGLYRYNIRDVVRCTGYLQATPLLEFLNKGSGISNITGEKLTEHQVAACMSRALSEVALNIGTWSLAPCWHDRQPYYGLFVEGNASPLEPLGVSLDQLLREHNIEYAAKRDSDRLGPIRVCSLPPGTWYKWDLERLSHSGGSAEQYKHPCLIPDLAFAEQMEAARDR